MEDEKEKILKKEVSDLSSLLKRKKEEISELKALLQLRKDELEEYRRSKDSYRRKQQPEIQSQFMSSYLLDMDLEGYLQQNDGYRATLLKRLGQTNQPRIRLLQSKLSSQISKDTTEKKPGSAPNPEQTTKEKKKKKKKGKKGGKKHNEETNKQPSKRPISEDISFDPSALSAIPSGAIGFLNMCTPDPTSQPPNPPPREPHSSFQIIDHPLQHNLSSLSSETETTHTEIATARGEGYDHNFEFEDEKETKNEEDAMPEPLDFSGTFEGENAEIYLTGQRKVENCYNLFDDDDGEDDSSAKEEEKKQKEEEKKKKERGGTHEDLYDEIVFDLETDVDFKPKRQTVEDCYSLFGEDDSEDEITAPAFESESKDDSKISDTNHKQLDDQAISTLNQWNLRFQTCLKRLHERVSEETTSEGGLGLGMGSSLEIGNYERKIINSELMNLSEDFVSAARAVGKMIISEVCLPFDQKVIRPATLGGRAGGEKFIVHNILFKFSLDCHDLFQGSDLAAAKVSGHELKGLMTYSSLQLEAIHLPLMALVDYRGFRVVAICVLPVSRDSLIYGTNDAGATIYNEDPKFCTIMEKASKSLNLKPHLCGFLAPVRLTSAADIEGHLGTDGKYYLLDFSRTMPPVTPDKRFHNGHLYRLFRREFLVKYGRPLCSDAFSSFVIKDPQRKEYNQEVKEATQHLMRVVIPSCADSLIQIYDMVKDPELLDLKMHMHSSGVNLRYIGNVIACLLAKYPLAFSTTNQSSVKKETSEQKHQETPQSIISGFSSLIQKKKKHKGSYIKSDHQSDRQSDQLDKQDTSDVQPLILCLLTEAIARIIKNELNQQLREKVQELMLPQEVPYRKLIISFLNMIFGSSKTQREWWETSLPQLLSHHFSVDKLPIKKKDLCSAILKTHDGLFLRITFTRIQELTGLEFGSDLFDKLRIISHFRNECFFDRRSKEPLGMLDLLEVGDRVKSMDIVCLSHGNFFYLRSLEAKDPLLEIELLERAIEKYLLALNSNANKETLLNLSLSYFRLLLLKATQEAKSANMNQDIFFAENTPEIVPANEYLTRLVLTDTKDPQTLCLYALFLFRRRDLVGAEQYFIRCLKSDPGYGFALVEYISFLDKCGLRFTSDCLEEMMPQLVKSLIYSPLSGAPLGGVVKVYFKPGAYKALPICATDSTWDICVELANAMKTTFKPFSSALSLVPNEGEDQQPTQYFEPHAFPWVAMHRSGRHNFHLHSPFTPPKSRTNLRPVLMNNHPHFKGRMIPGVTELFAEIINPSTPTVGVEALLWAHSLLATGSHLIQMIREKGTDPNVFKLVKIWASDTLLVDMLDAKVASKLMTVGMEKSSPADYGGAVGLFVGSIDGPVIDIPYDVCQPSILPFEEQGSEKDELEKLFSSMKEVKKLHRTQLEIHSLTKSEIRQMAESLTLISLAMQSRITVGHFLHFASNCTEDSLSSEFYCALKYEESIFLWVSEYLVNDSFEYSLKSFDHFVQLANESFELGDFGTSSAIIDALVSDKVIPLHRQWVRNPDHLPIRVRFQTSPSYYAFVPSFNATGEKNLERYLNCFAIKNATALKIPSLSRLHEFIMMIGPILKTLAPVKQQNPSPQTIGPKPTMKPKKTMFQRATKSMIDQGLNFHRCVASYRIIRSVGILNFELVNLSKTTAALNESYVPLLLSGPLEGILKKITNDSGTTH